MNHQLMIDLRAAKVEKVADFIPEQEIDGPAEGDLLVVSWGGTYGQLHEAVKQMPRRRERRHPCPFQLHHAAAEEHRRRS